MEYNLFKVKIRENSKYNTILELLKLSIGNNITNLTYNKKESPNQNLEINVSYNKKYIKKNNGKMIYKNTENNKNNKNNKNKEIKIFDKEFISNNIKRAKMTINNKKYNLKEIIENQKQSFKIEIKFLDNIIYLIVNHYIVYIIFKILIQNI